MISSPPVPTRKQIHAHWRAKMDLKRESTIVQDVRVTPNMKQMQYLTSAIPIGTLRSSLYLFLQEHKSTTGSKKNIFVVNHDSKSCNTDFRS